ncbi:DUF4825 domain-containing protein [Alicyclobacillus dauci]|uniref:DUF4825 domain-containing protein n=1 Tax=Alicyclobacillus dauci TaxID=1475485 RepID=A0ABY6ZAD1_9BACL|nr:DUF4825 domain-containing protein [Alicyclobacillus dauci]WAH39216.1 DUF4825 domain-containing protein [Alicyclobacillus dauci]
MLAVPLILTSSLCLAGCSTSHSSNQTMTKTYHVVDFLKYKGTYVGDNSAVGNILSMLPAHNYMAGFSLQTEHKPYGITVNYTENQKLGPDNYYDFWNSKKPDELLERNAAALFSLVQNVDSIQFHVQDVGNFTYNRADLQQKYGDLSSLLHDQSSFNNFLNG